MGTLPHRTALVTGATAGIGYWTALGLAARGDTVYITGRDQARGRAAAGELRGEAGHDRVHFLAADHATVAGNADLAVRLTDEDGELDVLVNNAGGIYTTRWETADGYEATLAMNLVGPFTLTRGLLPLLRRGAGRCVNVVSSAYGMHNGDPFHDIHATEKYVAISAYARAKLLNILWSAELARREQEADISVVAVNPGMAWTPSIERLGPRAVPAWRPVWPVVRWFQRRASPRQAASAPITAASAWEIAVADGTAGSFLYLNENGKQEPLAANATDPSLPPRAWQLAESLAAAAPTVRERA